MPRPKDSARPAGASPRHGPDRWTLAALAGLALLLLWVPLVTGLRFPSKMDEVGFHVPNVQRYVDHFPSLQEMRDTDLSMPPLFHAVLGFLARFTGAGLPDLRGWMLIIGLCAMLLFLLAARRIEGVDWRLAGVSLAAFPYFGVCYFVVMTDYPALLALLASFLAQLAYLRSGRSLAAWGAGAAGAAACLIRQNFIFAAGVFVLVLWLADRRWIGPGARATQESADPRTHATLLHWSIVPALLLPFLAVAFQVWLWKGLIPPAFMAKANYFDSRPATMLLSAFSIGANVGYYLWPASLLLLWIDRRKVGPAAWIALAVITLFGLYWCFRMRGRDLVDTYGTFRHGLGFIRSHAGFPAALITLAVSLASFMVIVLRGGRWVLDLRSGAAWLLGGLFLGSLAVSSYGLFRIYERHVLPVYVFAVLLLMAAVPRERSRAWRWGWWASALFTVAHAVVYSVVVYELIR